MNVIEIVVEEGKGEKREKVTKERDSWAFIYKQTSNFYQNAILPLRATRAGHSFCEKSERQCVKGPKMAMRYGRVKPGNQQNLLDMAGLKERSLELDDIFLLLVADIVY